jgi:hypothetical protein
MRNLPDAEPVTLGEALDELDRQARDVLIRIGRDRAARFRRIRTTPI